MGLILLFLDARKVGDPKTSAWIRKLSVTDTVVVAMADGESEHSPASIELIKAQARELAESALLRQMTGKPEDHKQPYVAPVEPGGNDGSDVKPIPLRADAAFVQASSDSPLLDGMGTEGLRGRQIEVATLVSRGLSNKEIGRELGMSENTVRMHLKKVFRKLKVSNRTQVAISVQAWPMIPGAKG